MDTQSILSAMREELNRIDTALAALGGMKAGNGRRRHAIYGFAASGTGKTRTLSAAARRKISAAAKARWAKAKKAGRNSL